MEKRSRVYRDNKQDLVLSLPGPPYRPVHCWRSNGGAFVGKLASDTWTSLHGNNNLVSAVSASGRVQPIFGGSTQPYRPVVDRGAWRKAVPWGWVQPASSDETGVIKRPWYGLSESGLLLSTEPPPFIQVRPELEGRTYLGVASGNWVLWLVTTDGLATQVVNWYDWKADDANKPLAMPANEAPVFQNIQAACASQNIACFITMTGALQCTGVSIPANNERWVEIVCGNEGTVYFVCGITDSRAARCFGFGGPPFLPYQPPEDVLEWSTLSTCTSEGIVSICGITATNDVRCWSSGGGKYADERIELLVTQGRQWTMLANNQELVCSVQKS